MARRRGYFFEICFATVYEHDLLNGTFDGSRRLRIKAVSKKSAKSQAEKRIGARIDYKEYITGIEHVVKTTAKSVRRFPSLRTCRPLYQPRLQH